MRHVTFLREGYKLTGRAGESVSVLNDIFLAAAFFPLLGCCTKERVFQRTVHLYIISYHCAPSIQRDGERY